MTRHTLTVARAPDSLSRSSLGTDALNAISAITGAKQVDIDDETDASVVISYEWTSKEKFWDTETHLAKYGLIRTDW